MSGTTEVLELLKNSLAQVQSSVLVPNEKGFELALENGVQEISLFAACSESFSRKNLNCSIDESFENFGRVARLAKQHQIRMRGYLSVCFGCPFEGDVSPEKVRELSQRFIDLGAFEVSVGDTIGVAHVGQVNSVFGLLLKHFAAEKLAGHFHDTRGQALANILAAYNLGLRVFDTSLGGLGGCPYAPGAKGNVATEDVVYMFEGMGASTGYDLKALLEINQWMSSQLGRALPSRVGVAGLLATQK